MLFNTTQLVTIAILAIVLVVCYPVLDKKRGKRRRSEEQFDDPVESAEALEDVLDDLFA